MAKKNQKKSLSNEELEKIIAEENIEDFDVKQEIEDSMLSYAVMTIVDRALPDIRDGLKPVHRRILWTCAERNYDYNKSYVKNAKIAGDVMGNYHPHSTSYGTIANMAQPWKFRYPLIDFQGNMGSLEDEPANERYTEGRLHKNTIPLLEDVKDKYSVDFQPNYSETAAEPTILPCLFPNFLCNPSEGIAVGYTCKTPGHNLNEVCDALIYAILNNDYTLEDLMKYIKGPDMPLPSLLLTSGIKELYETGQQKLTFRATYKMETNKENGNPQIVFNSITPDMDKPRTIEKIGEMISSKELPRVLEVRDESKGIDIRIVLECHPTVNTSMVVSDLYTKTDLQKNISFFMRGVVGTTLKLVTLMDYVDIYLEHRRDVLTRRFKYQVQTLNHKLNIQQGLAKVTKGIKTAINKIIESETTADAKSMLMNDYKLNEEQANYILDKKISSLSRMDRNKIFELIKDLETELTKYQQLLTSEDKFKEYMVQQLRDLKKQMGDERRTVLVDTFDSTSIQADIPQNIVLTLSNNGAISFYEEDEFKKFENKKSFRDRQNTFVQVLHCNRNSEVSIIFNNGEYIRHDVSSLQYNNIKMTGAVAIVPYGMETDKKLLIICKDATAKKISLDKIKARRGKNNVYIINTDSKVFGCYLVSEDDVITLLTSKGNVARFGAKSFGTSSFGGKGMATAPLGNEHVVDVVISDVKNEENNLLLGLYVKNDGSCGYKVVKLNDFIIKGRKSRALPFLIDNDLKCAKRLAIGEDTFELLDYKNQYYVLKKFKIFNRNNKGAEYLKTVGENYQNLTM